MGTLHRLGMTQTLAPLPHYIDGFTVTVTTRDGLVFRFYGYNRRDETTGDRARVEWGKCSKFDPEDGSWDYIDPPFDLHPTEGEDEVFDENIEGAIENRMLVVAKPRH